MHPTRDSEAHLGLLKTFRGVGRSRAQIRFELIDIFNMKYFSNPVNALANPNFGNVISLTGEPRQGQIGSVANPAARPPATRH